MTASFAAGPPGLLRALNARAVLETVAAQGPTTRADVAAATQLSKPTVAACLASLVERGAVEEDGAVSGRKGPAATLYRLAPQAVWAIGLDIGHDRLRGALVDAAGDGARARRRPGAATPGRPDPAGARGLRAPGEHRRHHAGRGAPRRGRRPRRRRAGRRPGLRGRAPPGRRGAGRGAARPAARPGDLRQRRQPGGPGRARRAARRRGLRAGQRRRGHRRRSGDRRPGAPRRRRGGRRGRLPARLRERRPARAADDRARGGRRGGLPPRPRGRARPAIPARAPSSSSPGPATPTPGPRSTPPPAASRSSPPAWSRCSTPPGSSSGAPWAATPTCCWTRFVSTCPTFTTLRVPVVASSVGVQAVLHGSLAMAAGLARESAFAAFTGAPTEHTVQQIQPAPQHLVAQES